MTVFYAPESGRDCLMYAKSTMGDGAHRGGVEGRRGVAALVQHVALRWGSRHNLIRATYVGVVQTGSLRLIYPKPSESSSAKQRCVKQLARVSFLPWKERLLHLNLLKSNLCTTAQLWWGKGQGRAKLTRPNTGVPRS